MSRGPSGRIVIEIDPELKSRLYRALGADNQNLKTWFVQRAENYITEQQQPVLFEEKNSIATRRI
jgi:hypothetical protein